MVLMPPGSAKSTYASVLFPAWFLAREPRSALISASHTAELAEHFGRRVRNLIVENSATLGYGIAADNRAAGRWETTAGGTYISAGVGGAITGRRADCVTGDTVVITNNGSAYIKDIDVSSETCYVLSYDKENKACSFQRVRAIARRSSGDIWRIRTSSGRVVEATGDHRFYTARGWIAGASLIAGDILLSAVREREFPRSFGCSKVRSEGRTSDVLQPAMRGESRAKSAWRRISHMPCLRRINDKIGEVIDCVFRNVQNAIFEGRCESSNKKHLQSLWKASRESECLLGRMQESNRESKGSESKKTTRAARMRNLWVQLYPKVARRNWPILQQRMRQQRAFESNVGEQESRFSPWERDIKGRPVGGEAIHPDQAGSVAQRWLQVRRLFRRKRFERSSCKFTTDGQSFRESCDAMSPMPPEVTCCGAFQTECDTVAVVERILKEVHVYDIQIEGTECFFANGILVHNCIIIDDPVKSQAEADSAAARNNAWNWYRSDLVTRLRPAARIVLVMTRWHRDDLGGRLEDEAAAGGDQWRIVRLPALAEADDPLGRASGAPLWPEWEDADALARKRAIVGPRAWSALFQQRPTAAEGLLFRAEKLGVIPALPAGGIAVRAWDLASVAGSGDWTVGAKLARLPDGRFVVADIVRLQGNPADVEAAIVNTAAQDGRAVQIGLPQDPGQAGKAQIAYLTSKLAGYRVISSPETGSKETRAGPLASQCEVGNVLLLQAPWNRPMLDEMRDFPAGKYDDQVDALSRAFGMLVSPGPIIFSPATIRRM